LVLSEDLLNRNLTAGIKLKSLGVTSLARFPRGTSVSGAIDALYRDSRNGVLVREMSKSGIYDLTAFPNGTSLFSAFKMIEDPEKPGEISTDVYRNYKAATGALKALGITTLVNFPRGTTVIEAQSILQPKAESMMAMLGIPKANYGDYFSEPNIDPLSALSVLVQLPNSIAKLKPLDRTRLAALPSSVAAAPELERARELARQATAAKNLVGMGYSSVAPFAGMERFAGKTIAHVDSLAASAATSIAIACDEVEIAQGAFFMIHNASGIVWGDKQAMRDTADLLEKVEGSIVNDYTAKTGKDAADVVAWMDAETWFTADEAVANGFCDRLAATA
jgi:hypothetical protein